ncbi:PREDICTED: nose resistant to fluoxetine protein 6-like [Branchiostoma belcheri]|uniref:Nose resistant to fluoxetine protein 6-like n=1 Tax=Branchiostoma belcheri TaxID=7741 RepID=A0A6P4XQQ3_BRABE|nr:PREDICTED: nose resistant to fluoxetine protein 6-like [Branchiostoma belcheri]
MVGVCVPSSCTQHDVIQQLDGSIYWRVLVQQGMLQVTSAYSQKSPPIQGVTIAAICICSVVLLLNAIGTVYDVIIHQPRLLAIKRQKESEAQEPDLPVTLPDDKTFVMNALPSNETPAAGDKTSVINTVPPKETPAAKEGAGTHIAGRVLLCFSLYTNIGKLLSTKQAPGSITCLHGIRFISLTWVILAHTYGFARNRSHFDNPIEPFEIVKTFTFQAINNSFIAVDSFFFLSGLLMSYVLLRQIAKKQAMGQSVPYGMVYFHRYWRLTPTYMFVLMLYMWVLPYMFSGPFWPKPPNGIDPNCGKNWWTNLLYINNLVNSDKECMDWTWYLANDMQFFVIGVPLVYILYRWQIVGLVVQLVLLLASFITIAVISWQYDIKAPRLTLYWPMYYVKPYCRIGPYLVGVFVGWMLNKINGNRQTVRLLMAVGWLVAAASAVAVLYSPYGVYQGTAFKTEHEHVLYVTLHRTVWGMALGWVVLACYYGYGGVVDIILSWKALVPLSKLTYCAYLGHLLVVLAVYLSRDLPIHFTSFSMIYFFLGHVALAYAFAFLVSVAVEIPLVQLETIIFKR